MVHPCGFGVGSTPGSNTHTRQTRAGPKERAQRRQTIKTLLLNPTRCVSASVFLCAWGISISKLTVSKPWIAPSAFVHNQKKFSRTPGKDQVFIQHSPRSSALMSSDSNQIQGSAIRKVAQALGTDQLFRNFPRLSVSNSRDSKQLQGSVIRTAARLHQKSSVPSSRQYTTRKPSFPLIRVSEEGVSGDYNHYRTVALRSTRERAISILTKDVSTYIRALDGGYFAKRGYR